MLDSQDDIPNVINFLSEAKLFNEILNNSGEVLVIDFRKVEEFKEASFSNYSINLPFNSEDVTCEFCNTYDPKAWETKVFDETTLKVLKRMRRFFIIVVFSNEPTTKDEIKEMIFKLKENMTLDHKQTAIFKGLLFYNMLIKNKFREIGYFIDDYSKFLIDFDHIISCTYTHSQDKSVFSDPYPSSILDHRLYVGDESHVKSKEVIKKLKITHIVNVTMHAPNYFENEDIKYLNIKIEDDEKNSVISHFEKAFEFIENAFFDKIDKEIISKRVKETNEIMILNDIIQVLFKEYVKTENRVLVHCSLGVSRSPSIALMYLMKKFNLSLDKSYDLIRYLRIKSCPIQSFLNDLEKFEKNGFHFNLCG